MIASRAGETLRIVADRTVEGVSFSPTSSSGCTPSKADMLACGSRSQGKDPVTFEDQMLGEMGRGVVMVFAGTAS